MCIICPSSRGPMLRLVGGHPHILARLTSAGQYERQRASSKWARERSRERERERVSAECGAGWPGRSSLPHPTHPNPWTPHWEKTSVVWWLLFLPALKSVHSGLCLFHMLEFPTQIIDLPPVWTSQIMYSTMFLLHRVSVLCRLKSKMIRIMCGTVGLLVAPICIRLGPLWISASVS